MGTNLTHCLDLHSRKYEVVKVLGRWGADFGVRGKSGSTAKDISNRNGIIIIIVTLI